MMVSKIVMVSNFQGFTVCWGKRTSVKYSHMDISFQTVKFSEVENSSISMYNTGNVINVGGQKLQSGP